MPTFDMPDDTYIAALPPTLRAAADSDALINVFRAMLRSPEIATSVIAMGAAQFSTGSLPATDRELVILTTGACLEAPYEAAQHEPISRSVGVTDGQRAALAHKQWADDTLSSPQQTLVRFAAEVAQNPTIPDELRDEFRKHYSDQQMVEVIILVGYYFLIARVTTVLEIPLDPPTDARILDAGVEIHRDTHHHQE